MFGQPLLPLGLGEKIPLTGRDSDQFMVFARAGTVLNPGFSDENDHESGVVFSPISFSFFCFKLGIIIGGGHVS